MNSRNIKTTVLYLSLITAAGCVDSFRSLSTYRYHNDVPEKHTEGVAEVERHPPDAGDTALVSQSDPIEQEEQRHEDDDALDALISEKLRTPSTPEENNMVEGPPDRPAESSPIGIPRAAENLRLSPAQCLRALKDHEVPFVRPAFETPNVQTPVLLSGPIGGVRIGPRYSGSKRPTNAVMDCHLALALVEVARHAATLGITAIEFYSTYRPLKRPPKKCPKGRGRKKCLKRRRSYQRAVRTEKSQHRFGRAIDIRWFRTADDRVIDVLEHFDRRSGTDPCGYTPQTPEAKLLSEFACGIHRFRLFNVMLTPNANKAHHNHFHFDLTPKARWYIIR